MIGIIGGNGVAATNKLNELIELNLTKSGAFRDAHHPETITWQATQVPSRSMYLEGKGDSFIPDYIKIGNKLKLCGCTELCMCCNTAHFAIEILENEIGLPFINILDEVAKEVSRLGCKNVGIMCSEGLRKVRLYDKRFNIYAKEAKLIYPTLNKQKLVTKGICNAKNTCRFLPCNHPDNPSTCFDEVYHSLIDNGADCVVAGCTDICNVYIKESTDKVKYVDSLTILANTIIKRINKEI